MAIRDDSVDVALICAAQDHSLIYHNIPFDKSMPPLTAFEELIYENPVLLSEFAAVNVVIDTQRFMLIPAEIDSADARIDMMRAIWPDAALQIVDLELPELSTRLLMAVEDGLLAFVGRTFLDARITHPIAALAEYFAPNAADGSNKIFVRLDADRADVIAFANGELRIANAFATPTAADATYYILAAAQSAGFSIADDEIFLCGDQKAREEVSPLLREFARFVMPLVVSSEITKAGKEALDVPFDLLVAMNIC